MIVADLTLTPALSRWLRESRDDEQPALAVTQLGADIRILRTDGSELSEREARHVRGVLAAHAVEKL